VLRGTFEACCSLNAITVELLWVVDGAEAAAFGVRDRDDDIGAEIVRGFWGI
jgi:hypothetical protein